MIKTPPLLIALLMKTSLLCLMLGGCTASEIGMSGTGLAEAGTEKSAPDFPLRLPSLIFLNRSVVNIDSLVADKADETVTIAGNVVTKVALLEGWLYEVQDDTGRIWVLSDRTEPEVGQSATVEGTVHYEPIVVGEIDAGEVYLAEKNYRQGS